MMTSISVTRFNLKKSLNLAQHTRIALTVLNNAGLMLVHRLPRWPNINPTLVKCLVFSENMNDNSHQGGKVDTSMYLYIQQASDDTRWTNVGLMLGQRLWRWPNIKPTLV